MKKRKKGSGGARKGAGRKLLYGEKTDQFSTTAPVSHIPRLKGIMKTELDEIKIKTNPHGSN